MTQARSSLLDLTFLRSRPTQRWILAAVLGSASVAAVYSVLAPKWYRSTVTLAPGKSQKAGGLSSLLGGGDLGMLAAGFDAVTGGGVDSARIAAVLKSNGVSDAVIGKHGLRDRYRAKSQEAARHALWQNCAVKTLPKPNLVELTCEDKDPQAARDMLQSFAELGNEAFRRANVSSAGEEVRFLERRVEELRKQADETASRLRDFQEKHRIVDLDTQAKAVVTSMASLQAQRIARRMELDYARGFSSRDEAGARQLESQLSVVESQLRDLEEEAPPPGGANGPSGSGRRDASGLFPAALAVPKLRAQYEGLYRDRKVAETTLVFALDRLEGARAAEARDVSTFVVMDPPTVADRPSRPKLADNVIVAAVFGFLASVVLAWWRAQRKEGNP